jgi:hypothetical protein
MYMLDFETMQQVMQAHQMTGSLTAEAATGVIGFHEPCRIGISIKEGMMISAAIIGHNSGRSLTGKDVLNALSRLGRVRWDFVAQPTKTTQPLPPEAFVPVEKIFIPQRIVMLDQRQMQSWPRLHRVIFSMADGSKSTQKIAFLLSASQPTVDKVLSELQSIGIISITPHNKSDFP